MISFSLPSLSTFALLVAQVVTSSKRWDSPMKQCQITHDNYHFNLCPLFYERHNPGQVDLVLHYETPPTMTTIVYNISLSGPLRKSDAVPDDAQCVSGTWACVTTRKRHPRRDLEEDNYGTQVIPIVMEAPQSNSRLDSSMGDKEDLGIYAELRGAVKVGDKFPSLSLHIYGGYYVDVPQKIQIDFECAESDDDALKLSGLWNGTHVLTWATKHACARRVYQTLFEDEGESDLPPADEASNEPPPDLEEPPPDQDLLAPPVPPERNGHSAIVIIACSGAALLGLGYLVIRPPAVLRKRIRVIRRAQLLRGTRESKLLRWAAEEIEMLGDEDEYEVDEMVNSRPLPDEQVPLRPSQTRTTFVDYGTAR
ncbi:hypothetical protein BJV74DRAFT_882127 [Russula compacta]|nr:hypothetical protein BJV74DRAFT_882127 [Russula compacta]